MEKLRKGKRVPHAWARHRCRRAVAWSGDRFVSCLVLSRSSRDMTWRDGWTIWLVNKEREENSSLTVVSLMAINSDWLPDLTVVSLMAINSDVSSWAYIFHTRTNLSSSWWTFARLHYEHLPASTEVHYFKQHTMSTSVNGAAGAFATAGSFKRKQKNRQAHEYRCSFHPGVFHSIDFPQGTWVY